MNLVQSASVFCLLIEAMLQVNSVLDLPGHPWDITYMVFQNKREQPNSNMTINIGTESIKRETAVKFLGFIIEDQPHWTKHLKLCKSKMASSIYAMRSAKHVLSKDNLRTLYFAAARISIGTRPQDQGVVRRSLWPPRMWPRHSG